jgi:hypothetical protein
MWQGMHRYQDFAQTLKKMLCTCKKSDIAGMQSWRERHEAIAPIQLTVVVFTTSDM